MRTHIDLDLDPDINIANGPLDAARAGKGFEPARGLRTWGHRA
ncbi:hypothetical protein [Aquabacterium sp. OR-4]|nr:hypothetical protein [Aquabacterium sp. OR-4]MDT7837401.1 hypothetical protein [Aquabacterium sp. OR-4]